MAVIKENIIKINLESGRIERSFLFHSIGLGDNNANRFGVQVYNGNEPADLTNVSCQGFFRNSRGENIALTNHGTITGNKAYITLPQACYNYEGPFTLAIKLVGGGVTGTMRIIDGIVDNTNTGGAVAPTGTVPTYQEVLAVYEQVVDTIGIFKGLYFSDSDMTEGGYTKFIEMPYGDYLCHFENAESYGFPEELGMSFYLHISDKAFSSGYAYKTFYAYSNSKKAFFTMAGGSSSASNLPEWNKLLTADDPTITGEYLSDTEMARYVTFIDVPRGNYFVYISTPGSYGFPENIGSSFYMEVSGAASGYAYKTWKVYSNNGTAMYAVGGGSTSASNLPKWNRIDADTVEMTDSVMEARGYTNFVDIPQGRYSFFLSEAGTKGFPIALGQSFILDVSYKVRSTMAYVMWQAFANNGTAMYAVGGGSTSPSNPPTWYYLTSNSGGGTAGSVNKFTDPLGTVKLLLLGDSITMGAGASAESKSDPITLTVEGLAGSPKTIYQLGDHWAGRFKEYVEEEYPNVTVLNHGWGGITLAQLAAHMDDFVPEDTTHCVIGLGVNSEGQTSFDGPIATIINYLLEKNIQVFAWTSWLGTHPNLQNINTAGRVQAALMHAYRAIGIEPLPVYSIARRYIDEEEIPFMDVMEWQPDNEIVHPNDLGHLILFRIIREGFGF